MPSIAGEWINVNGLKVPWEVTSVENRDERA